MKKDKQLKDMLEERIDAYVDNYKFAINDRERESTDLAVRQFIDGATNDLAYNLIYWAKYQREKLI